MRLLANGEEVLFRADSADLPRVQYWLYTVWMDGSITIDDVVCRGTNAILNWKLDISIEIAGEWIMHERSGAMQDTFEQILSSMEDAGIPRGLAWREENVGPCADPYNMNIAAAPVEWSVQKS
jgi:hypothetical protein